MRYEVRSVFVIKPIMTLSEVSQRYPMCVVQKKGAVPELELVLVVVDHREKLPVRVARVYVPSRLFLLQNLSLDKV